MRVTGYQLHAAMDADEILGGSDPGEYGHDIAFPRSERCACARRRFAEAPEQIP
jgi:hypothetical protein